MFTRSISHDESGFLVHDYSLLEDYTAPAQTDGEAPAQTDGEAPAQTGGEAPAQTGGEAPAQTDGEAPAQTDGEAPAQTDGEAPAQTGGEAPAQTDGEAPAQTDGEAPAQTDGEAPAQTDGEAPADTQTLSNVTSGSVIATTSFIKEVTATDHPATLQESGTPATPTGPDETPWWLEYKDNRECEDQDDLPSHPLTLMVCTKHIIL